MPVEKDIELKPCPLCGRKVAVSVYDVKHGLLRTEYSARIECDCGLSFEKEWVDLTGYTITLNNNDIITAWNKRYYDCPESCATSARLNGNMLWVSPGVYERIKNNPDEIVVESQCQAPLFLKVVGWKR